MCDIQQARNSRRSFLVTMGLMASCCVFLGCSGGAGSEKVVGDATITITSGGQPVAGGRVELETDRPGEGAGGDLDAAGVAKLTGVTAGEYTVTVRPAIVIQAPGEPPVKKADTTAFPERFRELKTSPLKIHIDEGKNEATFDLKEAK